MPQQAGGSARPPQEPAAGFTVLGGVGACDKDGVPLDLKGPMHRAVLARLLVARGKVVPLEWLVDDLWDDPPPAAVGAIRTFVSTLRRALEPGRPPRAPARLLVTVGPGYALRPASDAVDAWRFESAVRGAGELLEAGRPGPAVRRLDGALALWRGPAYAEWAGADWTRAEAARLEGLRLLAVERRAAGALALGGTGEVVLDLEAQVAEHPWREESWRLLALALYRSGRQGDALTALRRARRVLVTELGVDPGPELRRLEAGVLAQDPGLSGDRWGGAASSGVPAVGAAAAPAAVLGAEQDVRPGPVRHFVGRERELALLDGGAREAGAGRLMVGLVSGDAGAGKTALAEELTARLAARGWITAWGRCPEHEGVPAAWPWTRILAELDAGAWPGAGGQGAVPDGGAGDRFRRGRELVGLLRGVVDRAGRPLLLVLDDLQWADDETLEALEAVVAAAGARADRIMLVGTYRETEVPERLGALLGRVARGEPVRVVLGGLGADDVAALVRAVAGDDVAPADVRAVHARSGGNPFFVRELARLCATEGGSALSGVPVGVRDVIRHRLAALEDGARTVLRQAAVIGPDVDLDLLVPLAGGAEELVLDAVDAAVDRGFLVELGPDRLQFAHALVRETLYEDISRARRGRWHTTVAETIETLRPYDVDALADHYLRAGTRATAARAVHHAGRAARRAEQGAAPHRAARLWQAALDAHDRVRHSGREASRARLELVMGLVRALAVTGGLARARQYRSDALADAERIGDPELTARVIGAFDVPANWTRNDDEALSRRVVDAAERTLVALPEGSRATRSRLLSTVAMELRGAAGPRGRAAAAEAEALARGRLGDGRGPDADPVSAPDAGADSSFAPDPALLSFALNARFMHTFERAGLAPERLLIGRELVDIAGGGGSGGGGGGGGGLMGFEVLGHLMCLQALCARAEFADADAHAEAADRLAGRYELPLVGVFTEWYAALKAAVAGRTDEARSAYVAAAARLPETGMTGLSEGLLPLALLSLRVGAGASGGPGGPGSAGGSDEGPAGDLSDLDFGPYEPWCRPIVLGPARGRGLRAGDLPPSPPDLLLEARLCLHARLAVADGDDPVLMERLYDELLPACGELAGAGSGLVGFGPVDRYAGDLAAALGRPVAAARHHERARALEARLRQL
ncbi:BTAD domain-containing putative transcriptional regulator [Streptomyces sp. NPDC059002]|uniref:BTAD domain-containing putative transcriptional regulator n=1 Tax=Streptomyces sp. NPDC059002 TaxID=3346690 RepID=UPI0036866BC5